MSIRNISEKDGLQDAWYAEARSVTLDTLQEFVRKLVGDYEHDYGTICHAMAASMCAAMSAVDKSSQGGITGFQAGCVQWEVLKHAFRISAPARLLQYEDMLYPQNKDKFTSISEETWSSIRGLAAKQLASDCTYMHPSVKAHMVSIAELGQVPFGLTVSKDS